jgi:hypothetical protein
MISHTYGTYSAGVHDKCEYLTLSFSPLSTPLRSRWRNNGLSADFLGEYVNTFLPASSDVDQGRHSEIRHAVAYVANELLENAMKYHEQSIGTPIQIHLELSRDNITVSATNAVAASQARVYRDFVEQLVKGDASALYFEQLEASATAQDDSRRSCLGLLTMINDHDAKLGWRFDWEPCEDSATTVTTSAVLRFRQGLEATA